MKTPPTSRDREILDAISESVCAWDLDSTITLWNAASEKLYGWSRDEAIGRNIIELLKVEYGLPPSEWQAQLFDSGKWQGRCFRHAKDGSLLVVDVKWTLRSDPGGAPHEVVETAHRVETIHTTGEDSAALITAYQALAESEKKYRDLFNFMPIAIWQLDSRTMRDMFDKLRTAGVDDLEG